MGWIQSELTLQSSPRLNTHSNHLSKRAVRYQAQEFWQSRTNREKLFATYHRKRTLTQAAETKIQSKSNSGTSSCENRHKSKQQWFYPKRIYLIQRLLHQGMIQWHNLMKEMDSIRGSWTGDGSKSSSRIWLKNRVVQFWNFEPRDNER